MSDGDSNGGLRRYFGLGEESYAGNSYTVLNGDLNIVGAAQAAISSVVVTLALGYTSLVNSIVDTGTGIVTGTTEFFTGRTITGIPSGIVGVGTSLEVEGLIDVTFGSILDGYEAAFAFTTDFGILQFPANVAIVLATLYVLVTGLGAAFDRLTGGS